MMMMMAKTTQVHNNDNLNYINNKRSKKLHEEFSVHFSIEILGNFWFVWS
jgi:hypothetical protein